MLATISDKRFGHEGPPNVITYYNPDVVNANDYYPFGMLQPGRKFSAGSLYRYGFNGKENDNDVKGEGNSQDYGMRIYDPRVGRFLSVDPLAKDYVYLSPYAFAGNSPIQNSDLDGAEQFARNYASWSIMQVKLSQIARDNKVQRAPVVSPVKPIPQLSYVSESSSQGTIAMKQSVAMKQFVPKPKIQEKRPESVRADNRTGYEKAVSEQYANQAQYYKNLQGATMDPLAAHISLSTYNTAQTYANNVVDHGKGIINGIAEGNYWSAAGNTALLALDVSPLLPKGSSLVTSIIPSRLARIIPEKYAGSPTLGVVYQTSRFFI